MSRRSDSSMLLWPPLAHLWTADDAVDRRGPVVDHRVVASDTRRHAVVNGNNPMISSVKPTKRAVGYLFWLCEGLRAGARGATDRRPCRRTACGGQPHDDDQLARPTDSSRRARWAGESSR